MNQIGSEPLKLMMNDEGVRYAWPLNWLCIELLVMKSHVLYMWYTPRKHVRFNFLNEE